MSDPAITPLRIFLSYSSEQADVATQLYLSLKNSGHDVFFDRNRASLPPGEEYNRAIADAIRTSDRFVFLISPQSLRDGAYTRSELRFAEEAWPTPAGRVLPVLAVPMDFSEISSYLKAVTVFRPQGNLVAEVIAEINWQAAGMSPGETFAGKLRDVETEIGRQALASRLATIDRQWENERKQYGVIVNGETIITTSREITLLYLLVGLAFSLFGYYGFTRNAPNFFGWAPTLIPLLFGLASAVLMWGKANEFERKESRYRERRRNASLGADAGIQNHLRDLERTGQSADIEDYLRNLSRQ